MKRLLLLCLFFFSFLNADLSKNSDDLIPIPPELQQMEEKENVVTQNSTRFYSEFANMLVTLVIIILVIFIISWFLKRMLNTRIQQMNVNSSIKVLERRSLSPKSAIYLLEINGKEMAVAETPAGLSYLTDVPPSNNGEKSFSQILEEKQKKE